MRTTTALIVYASILACLPTAFAFPPSDIANRFKSKRAADAADSDHGQKGRIIKFPPPPTFTGLKKIPDDAHPFRPPGPGDMRGPCPGLNTLANHGYLPRDGITTPEEIVVAAAEGFNMHFEFAQLLASFGTLTRGNALTGQLSIGGPSPRIPALPGGIDGKVAGGIATHGRFEGDVSMTRADAAIGDNVNFQPPLFAELLEEVAKFGDDGPDGPHTIANEKAFAEYKLRSFTEDQKNDPSLQYPIGRQFGAFAEVSFILNMFPNGTEGGNGNLTVKMMTSLFRNQTFGDNWFRRSSPADFVAITTISNRVRNAHPVPPGANGPGGKYIADTPAFTNFFCDAYADIAGNIPPHTLQNTTGILKQNVDTLVAAMFKPFKDNAGCTHMVLPNGPAGI